MKVLLLANNSGGLRIGRSLKEQGAEIVGLVLHSPSEQKFGDEIRECTGLDEDRVFFADDLEDLKTLEKIWTIGPDMGVSAYFGTILKKSFLEMFPKGCINIHPALLPFNRGAHPNVWSIVEGSPSGVTIHYIDEGVDTGDVIAQRKVPVKETDTGKTLYLRLEDACVELFDATWPLIVKGEAPRVFQYDGKGSFHKQTDLKTLDEIKPGDLYTAKELVDILRARTFPPYPGAYMVVDGKKVFLRLEMSLEEEEHYESS